MRKKLTHTIALSFFYSFFISISFAQNGAIKGKIKNGENLLPAATISAGMKFALSDNNGEFLILLLPGTYKLTVTHSSYKKFEQEVTVELNKTQSLVIDMISNEKLDEVVILGSRSAIQRSNLSTPAPVDILSSKNLLQTGQPGLTQMLNFLVPSFNASAQHVMEPVTLRGLDPDHVLILVNGIRYHPPAWVVLPGNPPGILGRGSVGNDLNSIPFSAIEKIEILRDGASAQYGSDAIAGVINIHLKKSTGKTGINLHLGQQYKGDGENITFGFNRGFNLNTKGFLNVSTGFRYRGATERGGLYQGSVYNNDKAKDDSIILARGFNRKTPVSNVGSLELINAGLAVNGGYRVTNRMEFFWTAILNYYEPHYPGAYRYPKNANQVNSNLYPDGFKADIKSDNWDISGMAGVKGKTKHLWNWEFSSVYGFNSTRYYISNSNNASQFAMGKNAPTEFYAGRLFFSQQTNRMSWAKDFAKQIGGVKTFNLGFGGEYRFESYQIKKGEEASWKNYDTTNKTQGGSQGFGGFSNTNAVNEKRNILGMYIDLETDLNDHCLIDIAGRYEYYSDFGGNLTGKLAARYKFSSLFSLRVSISNGFHAPSLQQRFFSTTSTTWSVINGVNEPLALGIFCNNSDVVARGFGVLPLKPEKAINLSGGFTSILSSHINLAVDAYWIQIKNRIEYSGQFDKTNPDVKSILSDFPSINAVQFITNAINTRTSGIDIMLNGNWNIHKAELGFTLAANFNQTHIFGPIQTAEKLPPDSLNTNTLFNIEERGRIEKGQPRDKIILSATFNKGKFGFELRNTRFGKTATVTINKSNPADRSLDEFFSPKILTDISVSYKLKAWITLTAGANNVFDVYPDRLKNYLNTREGILIYSNGASPFGFNGGYYFVNIAFNW